jgi:hypothetical protein
VRCAEVTDQHQVFGVRGKDVAAALKGLGLRQTVVEIRASGATQSAMPPSVIIDGDGVRDKLVWSSGRPPGTDLPEMLWQDLIRRVGILAFASFAGALGVVHPRSTFARHLYGALREADIPVATSVSIVWEVEHLFGGTSESDPAATHDGEGLASFLELVGLPGVEGAVRSWLGLTAPARQVAAPSDSSVGISADDLETLLGVLDPCDFASYDAWRALLFASHSATGGSKGGREVFVDWSARNPDYSESDWQEKVRSAWRRAKSSRPNKIGVGTLLKQVIDTGHGELVRRVMRKYDRLEDNNRSLDAPIKEVDRSQLDAAPILDELPRTEGI